MTDFLLGLLTNISKEQLRTVAERFRSLVAASSVYTGAEVIQITISGGGTLISSSDTLESVLKRADCMLYQSKQDGRNRVTLEPDALQQA